MDVDDLADDLYALTPAEFTAARDAQAKQLRAAGEREAAAAVAKLRRPTVGAWLANRLVRDDRGALSELLDLGATLRAAQRELDGAQLRALSGQQHRVVDALTAQARRRATTDGHRVSDEAVQQLSDTLRAALADPDAADALLAGRLSTALSYAGFGPAPDSAPGPREQAKPAPEGDNAALRTARAHLAEAGRDLEAARAASGEVESALADARSAAVAARAKVRKLQKKLAEATRAQDDAQQREHQLSFELRQAARAVGDAERHRDAAAREVARLDRN